MTCSKTTAAGARARRGLVGVWLVAASVAPMAQTPAGTGTFATPRPGTGPAGAVATVRTSHLTVQAAASGAPVAPGGRVSLAIEVTPRRGMHVYAPGKHDYQVVRFTLDTRPWLASQPLKYPPSEIYHFVPLDERIETYIKPFTLEQELTILATPEARKALAGQKAVTVSGTLEYQACDDKICYAPAKVLLTFTVDLAAPAPRPGR